MGLHDGLLLQVACLALAAAAGAAGRADLNSSNVQLKRHTHGSPSVYVACTRDVFNGTSFDGAGRFPGAVDWITRNQLLIEGISPMVSLSFVNNATSPGGVAAAFNWTGPLSGRAASWIPLFRLPEDAACNLARATGQYKAARPNGPSLVLNPSVLNGVANKDPGAWQPQGFFVRVDSAKHGLLFKAQRLFDDGGRLIPIRSVTKALVAATFMRLSEQGLIALDGRAADHVPSFKRAPLDGITFRMLLSHTSGLPEVIDKGRALLDPNITLMRSAAIIAEEYPLDTRPGAHFNYTELGYQVVCAAMEAATGRSVQALIREHVTGPIGMANTEVYNQWQQGFSTNPGCAFGGVSSPNDMWAFMRMLLARGAVRDHDGRQRRVLSAASVDEITTPQPAGSGFGTLLDSILVKFSPHLQRSGLLRPAATAVYQGVLFGNMTYGLGVPLTHTRGGTARNAVLIGGAGQMFVMANIHDPANALVAGCSNFQDVPWGFTVSGVVLSEVLAGLV